MIKSCIVRQKIDKNKLRSGLCLGSGSRSRQTEELDDQDLGHHRKAAGIDRVIGKKSHGTNQGSETKKPISKEGYLFMDICVDH
ncbi:hypothetical protein GDO81_008700 [Engystomops pustulosus]|uniref:Uncharacterized protein n=1 Tax=Engystomops pustulosus TaxID=76066 RepID=A0AAV7CGK0_ENGPU|nr:hypothetical protein GDO81_008700 [Engystomops pustulosus]